MKWLRRLRVLRPKILKLSKIKRHLSSMIPGFLHHLTKKASDGVVGHGLAASVPEKMRETFRNVACRFAEIRPKLKMAHDLQPAEVEKVEAAFRSGELDGWLNSEATEDFSSWPVVQVTS